MNWFLIKFKCLDMLNVFHVDAINVSKKAVQAPPLMVEETCGRNRGKRTYTVTPTQIQTDVNLLNVLKNAESEGFVITSKGNLGVTISNVNKLR